MRGYFFYSADVTGTNIHIQGIVELTGYNSPQRAFESVLEYIAKTLNRNTSDIKLLAFNKICEENDG
jgi:thioredoxin-related protein